MSNQYDNPFQQEADSLKSQDWWGKGDWTKLQGYTLGGTTMALGHNESDVRKALSNNGMSVGGGGIIMKAQPAAPAVSGGNYIGPGANAAPAPVAAPAPAPGGVNPYQAEADSLKGKSWWGNGDWHNLQGYTLGGSAMALGSSESDLRNLLVGKGFTIGTDGRILAPAQNSQQSAIVQSGSNWSLREDGRYTLSAGRIYDPKTGIIWSEAGGNYDPSTGMVTDKSGRHYYMSADEARNGYWMSNMPEFSDGKPVGGVATKAPAASGGGAVFGGDAPATGTGLLGSGASSGSSSISPSLREVDKTKETIEGRIGALLGVDGSGNYTNPVVRQAAESAMQQFASRGLLNSSMASEAAYQAAISKAIEIAGPDAQTYFAQGRANQDAINVFARDDKTNAHDAWKFDQSLALDRDRLALDSRRVDIDADQFNRELQSKYDLTKLEIESRAQAEETAQRNQIEISNHKLVQDAYKMYIDRLHQIDSDPNLDAAAKIKLKNEAGADFDRIAKYYKVADELDLGNRFSASTSTETGDKQPDGKAPEAARPTGIMESGYA